MNICIDVRPALTNPTGVGVYLENIVAALAELDSENNYHLFSSSWRERFARRSYGPNFRIHDQYWPVRFLNYAWHRFSQPTIERLLNTSIDIAHSPTPLLMPSKQAHRITTVHDLYFYFHPEHTIREIRNDYPALIRNHCERSDAIIAVSDYTRQQLMDHLKIHPSKVYTIRHGCDPFFAEQAASEESFQTRARLGITEPFFLFVGTQEPRKNLATLLRAFSWLKDDVQLVLAGPPGWGEEDWNDLITSRVVRTGYLQKRELRALYQHAIAVVIPSLDEGFGLPMIEAMAAGAAVIASRIPAFNEVAQDAFLAFDPNQPEELHEILHRISADSSLRCDFIARGRERFKKFSWRESAQKTLDLYKNL